MELRRREGSVGVVSNVFHGGSGFGVVGGKRVR
jgi:hypothetical protein